jgi:hypothetical protein
VQAELDAMIASKRQQQQHHNYHHQHSSAKPSKPPPPNTSTSSTSYKTNENEYFRPPPPPPPPHSSKYDPKKPSSHPLRKDDANKGKSASASSSKPFTNNRSNSNAYNHYNSFSFDDSDEEIRFDYFKVNCDNIFIQTSPALTFIRDLLKGPGRVQIIKAAVAVVVIIAAGAEMKGLTEMLVLTITQCWEYRLLLLNVK